jgi:hypothetical protein
MKSTMNKQIENKIKVPRAKSTFLHVPTSDHDIVLYCGEVPGLYLVQLGEVARGTCEYQIYVVGQKSS